LSVDFSVEYGLPATWDEPRITALVDTIVRSELAVHTDYVVSLHLVGDATIHGLGCRMRRPTSIATTPTPFFGSCQ